MPGESINEVSTIIKSSATVIISLVALILSFISFRMQQRIFETNDMPDIEINSFGIDFTKIRVITNFAEWRIDKTVELTDKYKNMLINSTNQVSTQIIDDKEYMLVNLLSKNHIKKDVKWENVILLLDVLRLEFIINKGYANTLSVKKAYSAVPNANLYAKAIHTYTTSSKTKKGSEKRCFEINMAYACEYNQGSSINLEAIKKFYKEQTEISVDFMEESENRFKAKDFVNFSDSSYLYKIQSKSGKCYYYTFQITVNDLFNANIWCNKEQYFELYKNICKYYPNDRRL